VATKIKLQRIGAKKKAYYRVIVIEATKAPTSGPIEFIGTYNPHADPPEIKLNMPKVNEWIKNGAQPTPKMRVLIKKAQNALKTPAAE
jgi:small subunit ribosomal protein S16